MGLDDGDGPITAVGARWAAPARMFPLSAGDGALKCFWTCERIQHHSKVEGCRTHRPCSLTDCHHSTCPPASVRTWAMHLRTRSPVIAAKDAILGHSKRNRADSR